MTQGGAIVVPLQIASFLRAQGLIVETWFLYRVPPAYEDDSTVRLMLPHPARGPFDYTRILWRLFWAMREYRPDAVGGVLPLGNVFGLLCARLIGCKTRVASQHTPAGAQQPIMLLLDKLLGTIGVYSANIAVSYSVFDTFKSHPLSYLSRLSVIQNGVMERQPLVKKTEARECFGLPRESFILGTVGRLALEKNHDFLFQLVQSLPGIHLAIAGAGDLEPHYQERIRSLGVADRVHLLGSLPEEQIPNFLAAIDVFVLPSKFEGLPIALIEAMQAGLPIIASDIPPVREVVFSDCGAAAQVLGTESVESWVRSVQKLQDDPAAREHLSNAAKLRSQAFSIKRMADGYLKILTNADQGSGPDLE